jgi:hypothetical protein
MRTPPPAMRPRVMWIPLVGVGAFLYWTTALGLGGLSLSFLGGSVEDDLALEPGPQLADESVATGEPIIVHLESWSDTHGVAGASGTDPDDGTASLPATDDSPSDESNGPGQTSY